MPVLQMRKPRQREVKELFGEHTGSRAGTEMKIFTLNYSVSCLSEPGAARSPVGEPIQPVSDSVTDALSAAPSQALRQVPGIQG